MIIDFYMHVRARGNLPAFIGIMHQQAGAEPRRQGAGPPSITLIRSKRGLLSPQPNRPPYVVLSDATLRRNEHEANIIGDWRSGSL